MGCANTSVALFSLQLITLHGIYTAFAEPPWATLGAFKASCAYPEGMVMSDPLSTHQHDPQTSEERLSPAGQAPEALRGWAWPRPRRYPGAGLPPYPAATLSFRAVTKAHYQTSCVGRRSKPCSRHQFAHGANQGGFAHRMHGCSRHYQAVLGTGPVCSGLVQRTAS